MPENFLFFKSTHNYAISLQELPLQADLEGQNNLNDSFEYDKISESYEYFN